KDCKEKVIKKASREVAKEKLKDVNLNSFTSPFRRLRIRYSRNRIAIPSKTCCHSIENVMPFHRKRDAIPSKTQCEKGVIALP
ncbi:MAG: hypothetical protein ACI4TW_02345, partial [Prevotella sp.]